MNRIEERFQRLKREGQKGLVVYIGAGDPNLDATHDLALAFDEIGVDVLELGVPFSDPLADGLVNQLAAQRGLDAGATPGGVLETVARIRESSGIPIVLYVYFNILHKRGLSAFVEAAADAGVDGLLVLDLPPEESEDYESLMAAAGLSPIYLVAPTTPSEEPVTKPPVEGSQARLVMLTWCPYNTRLGPPSVAAVSSTLIAPLSETETRWLIDQATPTCMSATCGLSLKV